MAATILSLRAVIGSVRRINYFRNIEPPLLTQGHGSAHLGEQPVQDRVALLRMQPVAQKPDHPAAEPHPVGQHGLGQKLSNLVNAGILHFGAAR